MTHRIVALAIACIVALGSPASRADPSDNDQKQIKALMDEATDGFATRNLEKSLAMYHNDEFMFFDVTASLPGDNCCGYEKAYQQNKRFLDGTVGPVRLTFGNITTTVDHDLAYVVGLVHFAFTSRDGRKSDLHTRSTLVFKRIGGKWTCVHEHGSIPVEIW